MEVIAKKQTVKSAVNKLLRIPQRVTVGRIAERTSIIRGKKELNKNIVTVIKHYKNKSIVTVKTDIEQRYLRPI